MVMTSALHAEGPGFDSQISYIVLAKINIPSVFSGRPLPPIQWRTYGLVGYDVRLTRGRSPVRSWVGVFEGSLSSDGRALV